MLSKKMLQECAALMPNFSSWGAKLKPSILRFRMNAVCRGFTGSAVVMANMMMCSASGPTVMKFFEPLRTQLPSP